MLSTFMSTALSGTSTDRNTAIRSRADRSTTTPMNSGSLFVSVWPRSSNTAVGPPMCTCAPVARRIWGTIVFRSRLTSAWVAALWGEVEG